MTSANEFAPAKAALGAAEIIVDALLGTGTRGAVEGSLREAIEAVNSRRREQTVVAVDIPSGAAADTGEVPGAPVEADYTVTFTAPKIGMLSGKVNECCGQLLVRDIGSPWELIEEIGKGNVRWSEPREFAEFAIPRKPARTQGRLRPRADRGGVGGQERRGGAGILGGAASGGGAGDRGDARTGAANRGRAYSRSDDRAAARHRKRQHFAAQAWSTAILMRC